MEDPLHKLMRENASKANLTKCLKSKTYKNQSKVYEYISLAHIENRLVLRAKKPDSDEVSLTADVKKKKEWIRVVDLLQHFLENTEIKQLRFCGVNNGPDDGRVFRWRRKPGYKDDMEEKWISDEFYKIDELIFDRNTEIYEPSLLKRSFPDHLTLKGSIEHLHHKLNYIVRLDKVELSRKHADVDAVKCGFFDEVEGILPNRVLSPQNVIDIGLPPGSEILARYYWTPKMMWNFVQIVQDRGGFRTFKDWMIYDMHDGNQLLYKVGPNGAYCTVTPGGWDTPRPSVFEKFLTDDSDEDTAKYFKEWEDEAGYTTMSWNSLPSEMKLACIKTLDFKSRTCLRAAGRTEMNVVDHNLYSFDLVKINDDCQYPGEDVIQAIAENRREVLRLDSDYYSRADYSSSLKKVAGGLKRIFANSNIKALYLNQGEFTDDTSKLLQEALKASQLKVSNLFATIYQHPDALVALKQCEQNLDSVMLSFEYGSSIDDEYFTVPKVTSAKLLQLHAYERVKFPLLGPAWLVEKWLENEAAIGQKALFSVKNDDQIKIEFAKRFEDRIITQNDTEVRIKMDNEKKHVLLKVYPDVFMILVIPCDLVESKYPKAHGFKSLHQLLKPFCYKPGRDASNRTRRYSL